MYQGRIINTQYADSEDDLNYVLEHIPVGRLLFVTQSDDKVTVIWEEDAKVDI